MSFDSTPASSTPADRAARWLSLLHRLTNNVPEWAAQKSFDSALTGDGDIDSIAPRHAWPSIVHEFTTWADEQGLGPIIICPHVAHLLHLVALDPCDSLFFELDVNRRKLFLGSTLFTPDQVRHLLFYDERGLRRLRPGFEGLLKLVQNGARRLGRPDWAGLRRKRVVELLRRDPEGMQIGARVFGPATGAVLAMAEAVIAGTWNSKAALRVEFWSALRAVVEPQNAWTRVQFRFAVRWCPVLRRVRADRRVPEDRAHWLDLVRQTHRVWNADTERARKPSSAACR